MKHFLKLLGLALLLLSNPPLRASMYEDYLYFLKHPEASLTREEIDQAVEKQIVAAGGFLNEFARRNYLLVFQQTLLGLDSRMRVTRIFPSSLRSIEQNTPRLARWAVDLNKIDPRSQLWLGHSKAGTEASRMAVMNTHLLKNGKDGTAPIVAKISSLQSPMIANDLFLRIPGANFVFGLSIFPAIRAMDSNTYHKILAGAVHTLALKSEDDLQLVSDSLNYIVSSKNAEDADRIMRPMIRIIGSGEEALENDALVAKRAMFQPGIGQVIGDFKDIDHKELIFPDLYTAHQKERAFALAWLRSILKTTRSENAGFRRLTQKLTAEFYPKAFRKAVRCSTVLERIMKYDIAQVKSAKH